MIVGGESSGNAHLSPATTATNHQLQGPVRPAVQPFLAPFGDNISEFGFIPTLVRVLVAWWQVYGPSRNPDGSIRVQVN